MVAPYQVGMTQEGWDKLIAYAGSFEPKDGPSEQGAGQMQMTLPQSRHKVLQVHF